MGQTSPERAASIAEKHGICVHGTCLRGGVCAVTCEKAKRRGFVCVCVRALSKNEREYRGWARDKTYERWNRPPGPYLFCFKRSCSGLSGHRRGIFRCAVKQWPLASARSVRNPQAMFSRRHIMNSETLRRRRRLLELCACFVQGHNSIESIVPPGGRAGD